MQQMSYCCLGRGLFDVTLTLFLCTDDCFFYKANETLVLRAWCSLVKGETYQQGKDCLFGITTKFSANMLKAISVFEKVSPLITLIDHADQSHLHIAFVSLTTSI